MGKLAFMACVALLVPHLRRGRSTRAQAVILDKKAPLPLADLKVDPKAQEPLPWFELERVRFQAWWKTHHNDEEFRHDRGED
jgi:hypothetical protein